MKPILGVAAAAAIALVLTGCASGATTAAPSTTSASPTPSPTPTATVAQYASVLTEYEQDWRKYQSKIGDCVFASIGTTAADQINTMSCRITAQTATLTAKLAAKSLRALPMPPSEISDLNLRTLRALDALAAIDATTACKDVKAQTCDDAETRVNGAIRPVVSAMDAWRPYF